MWIKVTKLDIQRGEPGRAVACPIARAVRRAFNWNLKVFVSNSIELQSKGDQTEFYSLEPREMEFVRAFDDGFTVDPFSFQIAKPKFVRGRPRA